MALVLVQQLLKAVPKPPVLVSRLKISCSKVVKGSVLNSNQVNTTGFCDYSLLCHVQKETFVRHQFQWGSFHSGCVLLKNTNVPSKDDSVKVLDADENTIGIMAYGQLETLARNEKKKLVNLSADKPKDKEHQVFLLLTEKQYKERNLQRKTNQSKQLQVMELRSKITDHDLGHKLKRVLHWIAKGYDVEILIIKKDENTKVVVEMIKKITEAVKHTARVKHSKVDLEKYVSCRIHLKPIMEPQRSGETLEPLKLHQKKREQSE